MTQPSKSTEPEVVGGEMPVTPVLSRPPATPDSPAISDTPLDADRLPLLLGEGWEIIEPAKLAQIIGLHSVLQGALAGRAKQIRDAFGAPCTLRIAPDYAEAAVAIDFVGEFAEGEWMAGRYRVMDEWLNRLPEACDELIVL